MEITTILNQKVQKHNNLIKGKQGSLTAAQNKMIFFAAMSIIDQLKTKGKVDFVNPTGKGKAQYIRLDPAFIAGAENTNKISGSAFESMRTQLGDLTSTTVNLFEVSEDGERGYSRQIPIAIDTLGEIDRFSKKKSTIKGDGGLYLQLHDEIIRQFEISYEKGDFTQYLLKNVYFLKKGHSWALYELCRMELNQRRQKDLQVEWLVDDLANKICKDKYRSKEGKLQYGPFKNRVLKPSIEDINLDDNCDMTIQLLEEKKVGRMITAIVLRIVNEKLVTLSLDKEQSDEANEVTLTPKITEMLSLIFDQSTNGLKTMKKQILYDLSVNGLQQEQILNFLQEILSRKSEISARTAYYRRMSDNWLKSQRSGTPTLSFSYDNKAASTQKAFVEQNQKANDLKAKKQEWEDQKGKISAEYQQWIEMTRQKYLTSVKSLSLMPRYLLYLSKSASAYERKFLQEWEQGAPSEDASKWFGRFLIAELGTEEENHYLKNGLKAFALDKHQFDLDAY